MAACALAAVATTAAPAAGAEHADEACSGWEAAATGVFDSVGSLTSGGAAARSAGNVVREPSLNATNEALPASARGKGGPRFRAPFRSGSTSSRTARSAT